ncbi:hypothetical protein E2C01_001110 [Portunus trituberculatus]|uniref:Uncharacterized protein n=1 Tax=Portunus trituberculatus TaxID=210409 RepID=A0A5B7CLP3_PORTR|nr:hypothetical protein [Portunus trituberculatus]
MMTVAVKRLNSTGAGGADGPQCLVAWVRVWCVRRGSAVEWYSLGHSPPQSIIVYSRRSFLVQVTLTTVP